MNAAALDEAIARFPRVLARCSQLHHECVRQMYLESEPRTIEAIRAEYRQIVGEAVTP